MTFIMHPLNLVCFAEQVQPYTEMAAALSDPAELVRLHWAPQAQRFLDWGNHTEGVTLQRVLLRLPDGRPYAQELQRIVDPERPPQLQFVPHFGWVSLEVLPRILLLLHEGDSPPPLWAPACILLSLLSCASLFTRDKAYR